MESISPVLPWLRLPQEVRAMIVQAVIEDNDSVAKFSTVSREWQKAIEKRNFTRIKLTQSCLADFGSMIHRNRAIVKYIWLCV